MKKINKIYTLNNKILHLNNNTIVSYKYVVNATAATNISSNAFKANWELVPEATNYLIDVSTDNFNTLLVNGLSCGNVNNYTFTGLTEETTYYYRLRCVVNGLTYDNSNTISVCTLKSYYIDYLLVSGGGSSNGTDGAAGGGAGGVYKTENNVLISIDNDINVVVGAGSSTGCYYNGAFSGENSSFYNFNSYTFNSSTHLYDFMNGAGADGSYYAFTSGPSFFETSPNLPASTGFRGGSAYTVCDYSDTSHSSHGFGGGGGGAGGAGHDATTSSPGSGGAGITITFGGIYGSYGAGGNGVYFNAAGFNGAANTGNGGSGNGTYNSQTGIWSGKAGGSGIVIIKYVTGTLPTMTGGTKTTSGGYTVHKFTTSGVFKKA